MPPRDFASGRNPCGGNNLYNVFYSTPYGNFLHSFRGELISCARLVSRDCIFYVETDRLLRPKEKAGGEN